MFQYVFSANVMVRVATRPAVNPVGVIARKLSLGGIGGSVARNAPNLSLPGKLMFPSRNSGHFSMLGLGDIVSPDQISMTEPEVKQKSPLNETNIFLSS